MFYDNYVKLCNIVNKSPSSVAEKIGFKRSTVTRWKNGGCPTDATLQKIADYFGVTVDSLKAEAPKSERTVSPRDIQAAFWGGDKDLSSEEKEMLWQDVCDYAKYKAEQLKKKKK